MTDCSRWQSHSDTSAMPLTEPAFPQRDSKENEVACQRPRPQPYWTLVGSAVMCHMCKTDQNSRQHWLTCDQCWFWEWDHIPQLRVTRLLTSMRRRVQAIVAADGFLCPLNIVTPQVCSKTHLKWPVCLVVGHLLIELIHPIPQATKNEESIATTERLHPWESVRPGTWTSHPIVPDLLLMTRWQTWCDLSKHNIFWQACTAFMEFEKGQNKNNCFTMSVLHYARGQPRK